MCIRDRFYIPASYRPMVNVGTKMKPNFTHNSNEEDRKFIESMRAISAASWIAYQAALNNKIANEVARMVLPLNIYTQMYWTVNARSLMNFLSLRVQSEDCTFVSYPQYEICLLYTSRCV